MSLVESHMAWKSRAMRAEEMLMDFIAAAEYAYTKAHYEYRRVTPDVSINDECWAEFERLRWETERAIALLERTA